jgi:hypothetical protein
MSIAVPASRANPGCREHSVEPIHHSSRMVAVDAADGPSAHSHFVTYRCPRCGLTWGGVEVLPGRDHFAGTGTGPFEGRGAQPTEGREWVES